jgi:hypothetical protein
MSLEQAILERVGDPEKIRERVKEQIREILRAYRHSWDVYSELIQNSIDAINRRFRLLNDPDFYLYHDFREKFPDVEPETNYVGNLRIRINVPNREIEISDNGVGIPPEKITDFLLPEGGDKKIGKEYGFKGYGLTYVSFLSQSFYLATRVFHTSDREVYEFGLDNLFDWLVNESAQALPSQPIPDVKQAKQSLDNNFCTTIRIRLMENYATSFPAVSSVDQAINLVNDPERIRGFEYLLRTRTAIGNTRYLFSRAAIVPVNVTLQVTFGDGNQIEENIPYSFYHPKDHEEIAAANYDFADYYEQYRRATFERSFRGLYHSVTDVLIGSRRPLMSNFALAAISSTRLSNIESLLGLDQFESGDTDISYGVHLSVDGMPTGLRIDDWDTKGSYLKRYYVVVDADMDISNQLDPGRKGISKYTAKMISDKAIDLMNQATVGDSDPFARYVAQHLSIGRGREPGGIPPQDFSIQVDNTRIQSQKQEEINGTVLAKLRQYSNLMYLPSSEQEVIALFYELQSRNIVKGYKTVYLSGSRAVYDAALEYEIECIPENSIQKDSLGIGKVLIQHVKGMGKSVYVHRDNYKGTTVSPELCVEFKTNVGELLREVLQSQSRTSKNPNSIDILITWDTTVPPSISTTSYTIDEQADNRRMFHSTTHRLGLRREYNTEIWVIALKNVLLRLP